MADLNSHMELLNVDIPKQMKTTQTLFLINCSMKLVFKICKSVRISLRLVKVIYLYIFIVRSNDVT